MGKIVNSRSVLAVQNLEISTRYYIDVLGFKEDPIKAGGWSFLSRDSFSVMLGECKDDRAASELNNHSWFVFWAIEGLEELYEEFSSRGALILFPPTDKPWGLREFGVTTPDGHRIVCGEPLREQSK